MLYTYIKTVSNSIEQQQYWTVADSDLQLRGGGGAGARGGHPDPEIRGGSGLKFFFRHPRAPPLDPPLLKSSFVHYVLEQVTDASSLWVQSPTPHPLCEQFSIELSLPEQPTLSNQTSPLPAPKCAEPRALTALEKPRCWQTTRASFMSQSSSQTVPHLPL